MSAMTSLNRKKGIKFRVQDVGDVFEYGQVLLLLICPVLLRCDGSKPECWQRLSVCGTGLN